MIAVYVSLGYYRAGTVPYTEVYHMEFVTESTTHFLIFILVTGALACYGIGLTMTCLYLKIEEECHRSMCQWKALEEFVRRKKNLPHILSLGMYTRK